VLRIEAEVALELGGPEEALLRLSEADGFAARQGAHMLALRIAVTRAGLLGAASDQGSAAQMLQRALERINEPDESTDLVRAHEMLGRIPVLAHGPS
jgi:hypothetical protein